MEAVLNVFLAHASQGQDVQNVNMFIYVAVSVHSALA